VLGYDARQVAEHRVDAAGDEIVHGECSTAIGHVRHFDAGFAFE
jgi:hypothetical protein